MQEINLKKKLLKFGFSIFANQKTKNACMFVFNVVSYVHVLSKDNKYSVFFYNVFSYIRLSFLLSISSRLIEKIKGIRVEFY